MKQPNDDRCQAEPARPRGMNGPELADGGAGSDVAASISLPPALRGRQFLGLTVGAAQGRLHLQQCRDCRAVQYPPREVCGCCLSDRLSWEPQDGQGVLLSMTSLHHSHEAYFKARHPWRMGLVRLAAGPSAFVHVHASVKEAPCPVRVVARVDRSGQAVLVAGPSNGAWNMSEDSLMREITFDPAGRTVLVTDGDSATGRALIDALRKAGAKLIWAGRRDGVEPLVPVGGQEEERLETEGSKTGAVRWVRLDVRDDASVRALAERIGLTLDLVISNAEHQGSSVAGAPAHLLTATEEMSVNVIGQIRMETAFGPLFMQRAASCPDRAFPWVNLLSIHAIAHDPAQGSFSASKAAAFALAQAQRHLMRASNVRVVHCFPGPLDEPGRPDSGWPKLSPGALAAAILQALAEGVEDIYPGDVAQDLLARWRTDPLALQREMGV